MITLARRVADVRGSAIRDLLTLTARPEVISLAGGLPAADLLPRERIAAAAARALTEPGAVQYAETAGIAPLRETVAAHESARIGRPVRPTDVVVTSGSQQALDLLARALLDPGDRRRGRGPRLRRCAAGLPGRGRRPHRVPIDADGMRVDVLAERLAAGLRPRLVHTVSSFHNPRGVTLAPDRRRALAGLADRYGFLVVEDDPYGLLAFDGAPARPVAAHSDRVLRLGSASKIVAPALRVGWLTGPARRRRRRGAPQAGHRPLRLLAHPGDRGRAARRHRLARRAPHPHPRGDGGPGTGLHRRGRRPAPRRHVHRARPAGCSAGWSSPRVAASGTRRGSCPRALAAGVAFVPGCGVRRARRPDPRGPVLLRLGRRGHPRRGGRTARLLRSGQLRRTWPSAPPCRRARARRVGPVREILELLERDAHLSHDTIATMTGLPVEQVAAQVAAWEASGVIRRYTRGRRLGPRRGGAGPDSVAETVTAFIDVSVAPARSVGFDDVAVRISRFPEVRSVYLVSGGHDLRCTVTGRNIRAVSDFVSQKLSTIDRVQSTATHFVLKAYKRDGVAFAERRARPPPAGDTAVKPLNESSPPARRRASGGSSTSPPRWTTSSPSASASPTSSRRGGSARPGSTPSSTATRPTPPTRACRSCAS